jgi:hypothetical protein
VEDQAFSALASPYRNLQFAIALCGTPDSTLRFNMISTRSAASLTLSASPRWESWEPALRALQGLPGTLWILSPFITSVPTGLDLNGLRVITTLDAQKLASDSTSIDILLRMQAAGADVRILPQLHAKVYLRLQGSQATGYTGSANLTVRAERRNKEVMTGPHAFDTQFIQQLSAHWQAARPLTRTLVKAVTEEAARLRENRSTQATVEEDVMVFSVETRILRGGFTLTEERVGVPAKSRTSGLRAGRVDFVTAQTRRPGGELVAKALRHLQSGPHGTAVKLRGTGRFYAVPLGDAERFHAGLEQLHTNLRAVMSGLIQEGRGAWREDFLARVAKAAAQYTKADPDCVQKMLRLAAQEYERYLDQQDVNVSYGTYLALQTQGRPLTRDHSAFYQAVREQQPLTDDWQSAASDDR